MTETRLCATRCKHNGTPTRIAAPATLCRHCEQRLRDWLRAIPDLYATLPTFIEHGTTDPNPDSKATKKANAPAPMRLDVIDLLDTRLARKWQGTAATDKRRGALGTLVDFALEVHDTRQLSGTIPDTVTAACDFLGRHMLWIATWDQAGELHDEVKALHRQLSDAVGDYRPRPVGRCHLTPEDDDTPCGGPLLANSYGGVRCPRCGSTWDANRLRILGLAQAQQETA